MTLEDYPSEEWTSVIKPHGKRFDLKLNELLQYRDLIYLFVKRDFISVYKQTILGPVWHIIQPLFITITFTIIFGGIASLPTDDLPPFLFYMCGTVTWSYFATTLTKTSTTFVDNSALFGKVYFPRMAIPVSILISNLISFAIQFTIFLLIMLIFSLRGTSLQPNSWILMTPILLFIMAGLGLGCGTIVSSLTTRYRDLSYLVQFGVIFSETLRLPLPTLHPLKGFPAPNGQLLQRLSAHTFRWSSA